MIGRRESKSFGGIYRVAYINNWIHVTHGVEYVSQMELWKDNRVEMLDFRVILIQAIETMRSTKIANHEKRDVSKRKVDGCYLHWRGKRKRKRKKSQKTSNLLIQTQKRDRFCLLLSGKDYFFQINLHFFGGGFCCFCFLYTEPG